MAERMQDQIWKPLSAPTRRIRVLVLEPSANLNDDPRGYLIEESLDRHPRYDAISHTWGGPQASGTLFLGDMRVPITASVHSCLRHLRHKTDHRSYWIDAICVNQYSAAERAQQVQQMEHIFRTAECVYVWLGNNDPERMNRVFRIMELIASGQNFHDIKLDSSKLQLPDATDLSLFTKAEWFSRLWPKQEAALARTLIFCHGQKKMDWSILSNFCQKFIHTKEYWKIVPNPDYAQEIYACSWTLQDLRNVRNILSFDSRRSSLSERARILIYNMATWRKVQVADARDRIYGLVGILSSLFATDLVTVDYQKPTKEVYTSFALNLIYSTGSLVVLNQACSDYNSLPGLPSWVPDWSSRYHFYAENQRRRYNASGTRTVNPQAIPLVLSNEINLAAYFFGVVRHAGTAFELETWNFHLGYARDLRGHHAKLHSCLEEWSVDYSRHSDFPFGRFARACFRGVFNKKRLDSDDHALSLYSQTSEHLLMAKNSSEVWGVLDAVGMSRFFVTDTGAPGMGPMSTQPGDHLVIMQGGDVPYVLRKSPDRNDSTNRYTFIGECYVDGVMDGQLVEDENFPGFEDISLV